MPNIAPISPKRLEGLDPTEVGFELAPGPMGLAGPVEDVVGPQLRALIQQAVKSGKAEPSEIARMVREVRVAGWPRSIMRRVIERRLGTEQERVAGLLQKAAGKGIKPEVLAPLSNEVRNFRMTPTQLKKVLKAMGVGSAAIAALVGGSDDAQAAGSPKTPVPSADNLDPILARMAQRESSGNPLAKGKKGESGLFQIQPQTAKMYGVDPELLTNPVVNRYVAKRYLSDLVREFKGNIPLAIAAYNAGPGRVRSGSIPDSTRSYVRDVLAGGTALDSALTRPGAGATSTPSSARPSIVTQTELTPPPAPKASASKMLEISKKLLGGGPTAAEAETVPIPAGASIGSPVGKKTVPIPPDARFAMPGPISPPASAPASKEPLPVRAATYLPAIGQFGGELGGVTLGAAIPGLGETGVPEAAFATAGGAGGSAIGAAGENLIRRQYGLPPVSVGTEAAVGGLTSAIPEAMPFVGRARKAAALAKSTGVSFSRALEEVTQAEANLEGRLGMGARKAKLLESAPARQVQQGYRVAKNIGLHELGQAYDSLLSKFYHRMTPNSVRTLFDNSVGRMLELSGKTLRKPIQDELDAKPMTVRRAQLIRSKLREIRRNLSAENRGASGAIQQLIDATTRDIKSVIGQANAGQLDAIDTYYSEQLKRFPEPKALSKAYSEPAAAEVVLKTAKGDEARTIDMIREMRRTGQVASLQRAVSTRIWQKAGKAVGSPAEHFEAVIKSVESIDRGIFDELYGKGAQKEWVDTARALEERTKELLKHPQEAIAIQAEVKKYLSGPGMGAHLAGYLGHRAFFDMLLIGGGIGYEFGHLGLGIAAALGMNLYEMAIHRPTTMKLLMKFATEKNPRAVARAFLAFINASVHAGGEAVSQPDTAGGASATP